MKIRLMAAGLPLLALPLAAQRPTFGPTLFWESGLINVPAAYVAPLAGDVAFNFSRLSFSDTDESINAGTENYNLSIAGSLWGRGELGLSIFSGKPASGLFGKVLLVDETSYTWRQGLVHWLPSVALGVRNVGGEISLNRYAMSGGTRVTESPTLYGVVSRTLTLRRSTRGPDARPNLQLSLSAGMGTGIFKDDGGLGGKYSPLETQGKFGGASLDFAVSELSSLSLMIEHDAWSVNAGGRLDLRGIRLSAYGTDLSGNPKVALSLGWQANVFTLLRGNRLEERTAQAERAQGDLAREARLAAQRVEVIQSQIDALRAIASQQQTTERTELERRLREEQDALKRLQDLIKSRDAAKKPPENPQGSR
jgi:hypothetical protein